MFRSNHFSWDTDKPMGDHIAWWLLSKSKRIAVFLKRNKNIRNTKASTGNANGCWAFHSNRKNQKALQIHKHLVFVNDANYYKILISFQENKALLNIDITSISLIDMAGLKSLQFVECKIYTCAIVQSWFCIRCCKLSASWVAGGTALIINHKCWFAL